MATNNQIKFFKGASAPSTPAAGMIWFCTSDRTIRVYTGSDWEKYAGLVNASWNETDKELSITDASGNITKLSLAGFAGVSEMAAELARIEGKADAAQNAANAAQADVDAVERALGDGFSETSTVSAQLAAVKATADAAAVKSVVDAALDLKADKAQVATDIAAAKSGAEATAAADATSKADAAQAAAIAEAVRLDGLMDARVDALEAAIGENGSVDQAIADAIGALDTPEGGVTGNGSFVNVTVKQVDGKVTEVSVAENDIAKASDLTSEVSRAEAAEEALGGRIDALDAATTGRVSILEEQIKALEGVTHFYGTVSTEEEKDALSDMKEGDVVIVTGSNKEYIYNGSSWIELGDTTAEAGRISALEGWQTTASQSIADNAANIKSNDDDILALQNRAQAIESNITNNIATKQELANEKSALNALIESNDTDIKALQDADAAFEPRIKANEDAIADINEELASMATSETVTNLAGRVEAVEGAISRLDGEQATQNSAIEAADAKGAQGISDAAAALAEAQAKVASVSAGDYISVGGTATAPTVSAVTSNIAADAAGLAKASDVYNALCWVEFN